MMIIKLIRIPIQFLYSLYKRSEKSPIKAGYGGSHALKRRIASGAVGNAARSCRSRADLHLTARDDTVFVALCLNIHAKVAIIRTVTTVITH